MTWFDALLIVIPIAVAAPVGAFVGCLVLLMFDYIDSDAEEQAIEETEEEE